MPTTGRGYSHDLESCMEVAKRQGEETDTRASCYDFGDQVIQADNHGKAQLHR